MNEENQRLPDFHNPPVTEVALSVQCDPLQSLRLVHLGSIREIFKKDFPNFEEHPPMNPATEKFGEQISPTLEFNVFNEPPVPRLWLLNEEKTELIQVQQDRFIRNWRKIQGDEPYPHYEIISESFKKDFDIYKKFLSDEGLGEFVPNQCEITYVNHIFQGEGWKHHGELEKLFTVWDARYSDSFLPQPEDVTFAVRYQIPREGDKPLGRLNIIVRPGFQKTDNKPLIAMTLIARGKPLDGEGDGVIPFFNEGREWIVRGFASITEENMHKIWERFQ